MASIAELAVRISADMKEFESKMGGFQKKLDSVGKDLNKAGKSLSAGITLPAMAAGGAILALATKTGQYADRIMDLSAITGMSTKSIQEWQHVAKIAGVETEAVTKATEGLVRKLPQLESEGGRVTEQLNKLGFSFDDLKKMTPEHMMDELIGALSSMDDTLERNAIGAQLFGGAWKDLAPILEMGADGIEQARKEAHALGAVMSDEALEDANKFRIEMERLKTEFVAFGRQLASGAIPLIRDQLLPIIREQVFPAIQNFVIMIGKVIEWYKNLSPEMQRGIALFVGLAVAIGPVLIAVSKVITVVSAVLGVLAKLKGAIVAVKAVLLLLSGPVGIVIAIIAALIAIGILLYKNWDLIKEKAIEIWGSIKDFFAGLWDKIKAIFSSAWEWIKDLFFKYHPIGILIKHWDNIVAYFAELWDSVKSKFADAWEAIVSVVKAPVNALIGFANSIMEAFENMINAVGSAINKIPSIKIPDWVPLLGGKEFGIPEIPKVALPRIPQLNTGTNYVPHDMLAYLHRGEAVVPQKYNPAANGMSDSGRSIIINATYNITDRATAEYANKDLVRKFHSRGMRLALR